MKPQFPFKGSFVLTQGYADNFNNYAEGHHGGLDIVPLQNGQAFPLPIYPIFNGSTFSIQDTDVKRGKGIKERVTCDKPLIDYLKSKGVVPKDYSETVFLDVLYWHILDVMDYDGTLTQDTPIAHAGNTGWVFTGGKAVPDDMKGVPPYPGLHLHLETVLKGQAQLFNLDKDVFGRIDPQIILNYKGNSMTNSLIVKNGNEYGIFDPATSEDGLVTLMRNRGMEVPLTPEGKLDWSKVKVDKQLV